VNQLSGELAGLWSWSLPSKSTFPHDLSRRLVNDDVTHRGEFAEQRCLPYTRATGDYDAEHEAEGFAAPNVRAKLRAEADDDWPRKDNDHDGLERPGVGCRSASA
jgi:hypothetical protein